MKTIKELKIGDLIYQSDAYFINIKKAKVIEKHGGYGDSYYIEYDDKKMGCVSEFKLSFDNVKNTSQIKLWGN